MAEMNDLHQAVLPLYQNSRHVGLSCSARLTGRFSHMTGQTGDFLLRIEGMMRSTTMA
jgi:hypothetical protein